MKTHAEATALQFGVVADSIHLNPARAKLAGGRKGALVDYSWSSNIPPPISTPTVLRPPHPFLDK